MVEERDQLGGNAAQMREPLAFDRRQHRGRIEGVVDDRAAEVGDLHGDPGHRADVREGQAGGEVRLEPRHASGVAARLDLGDGEEARMRVPGPFRRAGRAAGEDDGDRVARVGRGRGRRRRAARERRHDVRRAPSQLVGVEPEDLGELRKVGADRVEDRAEVDVVPAVDRDQQPGARPLEHVADLAPPVAHVETRGHGAEPRRGEVGDQIQWCRGQQERDDVALPDAVAPERRGQAVGQRVPVAIGEPFTAIAEGLGLGRLACDRAQKIA